MKNNAWYFFVKDSSGFGHWINLYQVSELTTISTDSDERIRIRISWTSGDYSYFEGDAADQILAEIDRMKSICEDSTQVLDSLALDLTDELFIRFGRKYAIDYRNHRLRLIELGQRWEEKELSDSQIFRAIADTLSGEDGALVIAGNTHRYQLKIISPPQSTVEIIDKNDDSD